jgi:hypothetical protein
MIQWATNYIDHRIQVVGKICLCDTCALCYTTCMSKRHKLLWQALRRALLILAEAIKVFIDSADDAEQQPARR